MREHFNVPDNYFLSHSVGCMPKRMPDHLANAFLGPWKTSGGLGWPAWMEILDEFRDGLGCMIGAPAENICPQTNVSSGLTKIIYALPKSTSRRTILCSIEDFPSIGFVLKQAERAGYSVRFVEGDTSDPMTWIDVWDETVGVIHITHAFSNTSKLAPVQTLCDTARRRGAISIVDIAQSAGIVPIDLLAWKPDFAIGTGVKYLCFGPGACFLYASDEMVEACEPIDVGWFSHEQPFEMDIHSFRYANTAMRFFGGTPSPAPFAIANSALSLWREIGIENAQKNAQELITRLTICAPTAFVVSPADPSKRGGAFVLSPEDRSEVQRDLEARCIKFDERPEGFRFSVHGYTEESEIENLIGAVSKL